MADVFISYAREDRARIELLVVRLQEEGWSVWWDDEIVPGRRFERMIDDAIRDAKCVVVAWSHASLRSDWVHNEALEGLERGILVPLMLETVRIPVAFRQTQAALLQGWPSDADETEMRRLLRGIREVLDSASSTPSQHGDPQTALAEIHAAMAAQDDDVVSRLAESAAAVFPKDSAIDDIWAQYSTQYRLNSDPPGAAVATRHADDSDGVWHPIGITPLEVRLRNGLRYFRIEREGYEPVEVADALPGFQEQPGMAEMYDWPEPRNIRLTRPNPACDGMVFVPGGEVWIAGTPAGVDTEKRTVADYWIDRYPVTNEEFAFFVEAGGYSDRQLWAHLDDEDFGTLNERCLDSTGRAGPAAWRFGRFPEGQERYPVTGISWHEAVAYARFRGGQLPTLGHWNRAVRDMLEIVSPFSATAISRSNYSSSLQPVDASPVIGAYGVRDFAGNAREWIHNGTGDQRATVGGSHRDPEYMLNFIAPHDPWSRDEVTGFRTMVSLGSYDSFLDQSFSGDEPRDLTPVDDAEFAILQTQLTYSSSKPRVRQSTLEPPSARRKLERFDLTFPGGDKLTVFIQQPVDSRSPLQPFVLFPGMIEFMSQRVTDPTQTIVPLGSLIDSGRAVVWPVYYGSNERYAGVMELTGEDWLIHMRDAQPLWRRDLGRTLDFLESLAEIDVTHPVFIGLSYGVAMPLPAAITEERFAAYVLVHGGLAPWAYDNPPIADMKNFLPRLTRPVFMLNGEYDMVFSPAAQQALFDHIGTSEDNKMWIQHPAGHGYVTDREMMQLIDWLDKQFS